ncbi:MAG TPA: hypothetical protein VFQ92_19620 [Blastocatellia bacterium]|nr:hypothetical protein [Blastocatellia bacterium]
MMKRKIFTLLATVLIASISAGATDKKSDGGTTKPADQLAKATTDLVNAANQYKSSVESLIPIYEKALKTATETHEKRKELYAQGLVALRDLEASEQAIKEAEAQLEQARRQILESDHLIAEAKSEQEMAKKVVVPGRSAGVASTSALMRYNGTGGWSLTHAASVQGYFASKFGRQLPISAFGQSATHNRMGFDHRNSLDVALHPDSAEGRALIAYLRSKGIPYIAFRSAVPGAATGAHIHIGHPSRRL